MERRKLINGQFRDGYGEARCITPQIFLLHGIVKNAYPEYRVIASCGVNRNCPRVLVSVALPDIRVAVFLRPRSGGNSFGFESRTTTALEHGWKVIIVDYEDLLDMNLSEFLSELQDVVSSSEFVMCSSCDLCKHKFAARNYFCSKKIDGDGIIPDKCNKYHKSKASSNVSVDYLEFISDDGEYICRSVDVAIDCLNDIEQTGTTSAVTEYLVSWGDIRRSNDKKNKQAAQLKAQLKEERAMLKVAKEKAMNEAMIHARGLNTSGCDNKDNEKCGTCIFRTGGYCAKLRMHGVKKSRVACCFHKTTF